MKISVTIIVCLFFLFGCSSNEIKTNRVVKIDINAKSETNLPNISIKTIYPFETNDSSLFGDIASIEIFSNRVYLLDIFSSKSLVAFSLDGKYLNRTVFGKGPNEMINPYAFFVDRVNESVFVWDQTLNTMFKYDLDLNYLSKAKYNRHIQNFAIVNKNEILVQSNFYKDFNYTLYSKNLDTIIGQYIHDFPYDGVYGLLRPISALKRTFMIAPLDYSIYQLVDHNIYNVCNFDFGKYKLTRDECENSSITDIWRLINSGQRVSSLYEIAESESFLLFHVYFNREKFFYAYSSDTGRTFRLNDFFENGILPVCDIRGTIGNNIFYALIEPREMIKFQKSSGLKFFDFKVSVSQNPFLLCFSISSDSITDDSFNF